MPTPEENTPVWDSSKTKRLAERMDTDAKAHEARAEAKRRAGQDTAHEQRWAELKRRAAAYLHESAKMTAQREQARKETQRNQAGRA